MKFNDVKRLVELLESTETVNDIEIKDGESEIRISRGRSTTVLPAAPLPAMPAPAALAAPAAAPSAPAPAAVDDGPDPASQGPCIRSPMVGTFYLSASPGTPPFVSVGQSVSLGDTVCIIEAMKVFNKIEADVSGTIAKCLVEDGQPVEFGQPLFALSD